MARLNKVNRDMNNESDEDRLWMLRNQGWARLFSAAVCVFVAEQEAANEAALKLRHMQSMIR